MASTSSGVPRKRTTKRKHVEPEPPPLPQPEPVPEPEHELDLEMQLFQQFRQFESDDDDYDELVGRLSPEESDDEYLEHADEPPAEDPEAEEVNPFRPKRALRAVNSVDTSLDPENYDPWTLPHPPEEYTVVVEKPKRNDPGKSIHWETAQPQARGRQNIANVLAGIPGVNRNARHADTPVKAWGCFFSDDMLAVVLTNTNKKINKYLSNLTPEVRNSDKNSYLREASATEIRALLGMLYYRGMLGQNLLDVKWLFGDRVGHPVFGATMSKNRYKFLLTKLSFDDKDTRPERWRNDRFTAFRELHDLLNRNCAEALIPSDFITIDETLYPMRSGISFRQYNRSKPAKYGLLFRSLNDARHPYTFFSLPYAGKPTGDHPTHHYVTGTEEVVKYLINQMEEHRQLRGCNLTIDRLCTSLPLTEWLFEKGITVTGTIQTNRKGLPQEMKTTDGREEHSYKVAWFRENKNASLHSYVVNTKSSGTKNVLLVTSMKPTSESQKTMGNRSRLHTNCTTTQRGGRTSLINGQ
uniref:uncharacterized protein n=1 Tax=Myxine glutinosa TaxID=7769 RepID=UPI00358F0E78